WPRGPRARARGARHEAPRTPAESRWFRGSLASALLKVCLVTSFTGDAVRELAAAIPRIRNSTDGEIVVHDGQTRAGNRRIYALHQLRRCVACSLRTRRIPVESRIQLRIGATRGSSPS